MRLIDAVLVVDQEWLTPMEGNQGQNDTSRVGLLWWRNGYVTIILLIPQSGFPATFPLLL